MLILTVRTDKPEAEVGLYTDTERFASISWQADRQLSDTIHDKIRELLDSNSRTIEDIEGVAVFSGPGSFTGLRIGAAVANALAFSLNIPIIGSTEENWIEKAATKLMAGDTSGVVVPVYGADPHTTKQRK
jgi:tRNA threonylcarbamoyl adenosine modification protein YeaZ